MPGQTWILWILLGCFFSTQIQALNIQNLGGKIILKALLANKTDDTDVPPKDDKVSEKIRQVSGAKTEASNFQSRNAKDILNALLAEGTYDSDLAPNDDGTEVKVNMYVRDLDIVDKARGELHLQLVLRQSWNDPRLAYGGRSNADMPSFLTLNHVAKIWTPDVHIENLLNEDLPKVIQELALISLDGNVTLSQRLNVKTVCYMNFTEYPMDDQTCSVRLSSDSYKPVNLVWDQPSVELNSHISVYIGQFIFKGHNSTKCNNTSTGGNHNSCIEASFVLQRNLRFALVPLLHIILLASVVSIVIFYLDPVKDFTLRLVVSLTSLALVCIFAAIEGAGMHRPENGKLTLLGESLKNALLWPVCATLETLIIREIASCPYPLFERLPMSLRKRYKVSNVNIADIICIVFLCLYLVGSFTLIVKLAFFLPVLSCRLDF